MKYTFPVLYVISDLLDDLDKKYHRLRQSSIDEELFDVVSGFDALNIDSQ